MSDLYRLCRGQEMGVANFNTRLDIASIIQCSVLQELSI